MSYLEPLAFCSIEEYRRHAEKRVAFDDLELGELYTYMSELDSKNREASKATLRVVGSLAASRLIRVVFHDEHLKAALETNLSVGIDDYATPEEKTILLDKRNNSEAILKNGYFRDYYADMYDHILSESLAGSIQGSA